jgi:hypothetical protein
LMGHTTSIDFAGALSPDACLYGYFLMSIFCQKIQGIK